MDIDEDEGKIKWAFVTFRSMEGAARFEQAYDVGIFKRFWLWICCGCCIGREVKSGYQRKLFHNKWLKLRTA